jgi:hypothetical protein
MLTDLGKAEARQAETAWTRELADQLPVPELFIVSPLRFVPLPLQSSLRYQYIYI